VTAETKNGLVEKRGHFYGSKLILTAIVKANVKAKAKAKVKN